MKNCELNDFELDQVIGGVLTPEAESWINANEGTIRARAKEKGLTSLANYALSYVKSSSQTFDLPTVKSTISQYIDISDL